MNTGSFEKEVWTAEHSWFLTGFQPQGEKSTTSDLRKRDDSLTDEKQTEEVKACGMQSVIC